MTLLPQQAGSWMLDLENCIFVPQSITGTEDLLYDEDGRLVEWSACRRGRHLTFASKVDPELARSVRNRARNMRIREKMLFVGRVRTSHYGHWLTEGLARMWPFCDQSASPGRVLAGADFYSLREKVRALVRPRHALWRWTLRTFDRDRALFCVVRQPAMVDRVSVVMPSIVNRCFFDSRHAHTTRAVGRRIIARHGTLVPVTASTQPVYLSRSRLSGKVTRSVKEEREFEKHLRSRDVLVVHPQELSLPGQVELFTRHRIFIGVYGSAFHTVLLAPKTSPEEPYRFVYLTRCDRGSPHSDGKAITLNETFKLIDDVLGNRSTCIPCLEFSDGSETNLTLNASKAISGLESIEWRRG